mmetsp:Transcript_8072/g.23023  ORF Transcript_8072/g.23023 Transcript_8072/m.23023 type:complete len:399 (-) Transcript_8072:632-1828(-)
MVLDHHRPGLVHGEVLAIDLHVNAALAVGGAPLVLAVSRVPELYPERTSSGVDAVALAADRRRPCLLQVEARTRPVRDALEAAVTEVLPYSKELLPALACAHLPLGPPPDIQAPGDAGDVQEEQGHGIPQHLRAACGHGDGIGGEDALRGRRHIAVQLPCRCTPVFVAGQDLHALNDVRDHPLLLEEQLLGALPNIDGLIHHPALPPQFVEPEAHARVQTHTDVVAHILGHLELALRQPPNAMPGDVVCGASLLAFLDELEARDLGRLRFHRELPDVVGGGIGAQPLPNILLHSGETLLLLQEVAGWARGAPARRVAEVVPRAEGDDAHEHPVCGDPGVEDLLDGPHDRAVATRHYTPDRIRVQRCLHLLRQVGHACLVRVRDGITKDCRAAAARHLD